MFPIYRSLSPLRNFNLFSFSCFLSLNRAKKAVNLIPFPAHAMDCTRVSAVIMDLDGTLLDTEKATAGILKDFLAKHGKVLDPEKEDKRFGKTHKESCVAVVEGYELPLTADEFSKEIMPLYQERWPHAKALPGVNRLIRHLHKHGVPLALASNSIKKHIDMKISQQEGWKEYFSVILGGDDVKHGKPSPDIFLEAARRLGVDASCCLVIEDSLVGVTAAKAAGMKVVAVPSLHTQADRYSIANSVLHSLLEFQPELWGFPDFEDWVLNALPIEPLYLSAHVHVGVPQNTSTMLEIITDDESSLPDQISGVYFGWAKLSSHAFLKVVLSFGWAISSSTARRVIQLCYIGEFCNDMSGEKLHLLVVGYIRKLKNKESVAEAMEISEEDRSIAAALDLPLFLHYRSSPLLAEESCENGPFCIET